MWLQTSPEFAMKRLLAAGATAIFQITKSFRACERGRLHNPEFTIVEWYRIGDGYEEGMQLLDELAAETLGRGHSQQLTYREAFNLYAGIDPFTAPLAELVAKLQALMDFSLSKEVQSRDLVLDLLLTQLVEPHLGREQPTILHDYPPSQAALAQVRSEDPPVAERFELYVNGMELANGYHELLDAAELRKRLQRQNELRSAEGHYTLPEDSRLLAAMDLGLPACSGCALGFDRLVMAATNAKSIQDVIAFPIDRA